MALVKCKECGNEISDQAITCPNCGAKTETAIHKKHNVIILLAVVLIIGIIGISIYFIKSNNPLYKYSKEAVKVLKNYKQNKNTITIDELSQEIIDIQYEFNSNYEIDDNLEYSTFSNGLGIMASSIEIDGRYNNSISNSKIDEYIKDLQDYR